MALDHKKKHFIIKICFDAFLGYVKVELKVTSRISNPVEIEIAGLDPRERSLK